LVFLLSAGIAGQEAAVGEREHLVIDHLLFGEAVAGTTAVAGRAGGELPNMHKKRQLNGCRF
jgi:hypothetical protein